MIINRMEINSSAKYEKEDKDTKLCECNMPGSFVLASAKYCFIDKCEEFSVTYMPHKKVVTPGVADNLRSQHLDVQMNLTLSPDRDHQLVSTNIYNQGKTNRTNVVLSMLCVPSLAMSLLCNNADLPTTTFGKDYDDGQHCTVPITKRGITKTYEMNFKQC